MTEQVLQTDLYREPPTAPGLPLIGNMLPFLTSSSLPIEFLQQTAARYGDVVQLKLGSRVIYLISDPELVREALVKRVQDFDKLGIEGEKPTSLTRFLGNGILTSHYEAWRPQRKLIQPLMHTKHITTYAETMGRLGERMLATWGESAERNIHADMMQVTMWIIADTMFGMDVTNSHALQEMSDGAQSITIADVTRPLPARLMGRRDRQAEEVNAGLTALVETIVKEHREQGYTDRHDLLSLLLETRDEDGNPMPDSFVRDNILTLFFAGHETTANTLTWAFYYLDQHPEIVAELHREVDAVLGGRVPTLADLPQLPYTTMVIKETMRVEPTVSLIPRQIKHDTELGGYHLKEGGVLFLSPYILHHDPRWWPEPKRLDPLRFSAENEPNIPDYAYLPFGGGPRVCIGNHFAMMEAQILLALIASRYTLTRVPGTTVTPLRQVTSSPSEGLMMQVAKRSVAN